MKTKKQIEKKINCGKCGYILGGIEVKENYGCNACNPFWKPACKDCGHINGHHLNDCVKTPAEDYVGAHFCKDYGSAFHNYEQGWFDEYTGKKIWKWGCSQYGCKNHCNILGGCIYVRKWNWGIELVCERCGHKWGEYC